MPDQQSTRPMTIEHLSRFALVSDPQAQPGGNHIAWVVTRIDDDKDTYSSAIWLAKDNGDDARQLTSGTSRDASPRWSPDGTTIAFLSNRDPLLKRPEKPEKKVEDESDDDDGEKKPPTDKEEKESTEKPKSPSQVWTIRIDGGEATQVSNHRNGAGVPSWSPDGSRMVFAAGDDVADDDDFLAPLTTGEVADERIIRDLSYRFDGVGYRDRYSHLWIVDIASGDHAQITNGDHNDADPQWSPVGDHIAFASNRRADRKTLLGASAIYTIAPSGDDVTLLSDDDASFGGPVWSPDGTRLAWLGHLDARSNTSNANLWVGSIDDGKVTNYSPNWDTSVNDYGMSDVHATGGGGIEWAGKDQVLALASQRGETQIWKFRVSGRAIKPTQLTTGQRRVSAFCQTSAGLAYTSGKIDKPKEIFVADEIGGKERQITTFNDDILREVAISPSIDLDVTAPDDWSIQAWLLTPHGFDEASDKKWPLIVQIHGGPHGMYGYDFFHEMQLMASRGYAVLFCNPRGSQGYGENFNATTRARWGESDMPDVIASLDAAIERFPWIDRDRLGITGGSYGGYLTNWIIGHDDRFKAAVTQRCVSNFHSFFGTSDIGVNFGEFEFGGVPWKDAELLLRHSPISYVEDMTTPLLIVHSENDLRCPIEQAEQLFVALKMLGRDVQFVRIPNENHNLSRSGTPSRRRARLHHLVGWFDSHM